MYSEICSFTNIVSIVACIDFNPNPHILYTSIGWFKAVRSIYLCEVFKNISGKDDISKFLTVSIFLFGRRHLNLVKRLISLQKLINSTTLFVKKTLDLRIFVALIRHSLVNYGWFSTFNPTNSSQCRLLFDFYFV